MAKFKIKKRSKGQDGPIDINITPMIDMMSMLNSFLLMTAVFSQTGAARVEIPFLSSKPPPTQKEVDNKPEKVVSAVIDNEKVKLEIGMSNNSTTVKKEDYGTDPKGLDALQARLHALRSEDPNFDKVTVMTEPETKYETLINVIDSMRELKNGRAPIPLPSDYKIPVGVDRTALIPKIVLGNVIL